MLIVQRIIDPETSGKITPVNEEALKKAIQECKNISWRKKEHEKVLVEVLRLRRPLSQTNPSEFDEQIFAQGLDLSKRHSDPNFVMLLEPKISADQFDKLWLGLSFKIPVFQENEGCIHCGATSYRQVNPSKALEKAAAFVALM